MRQSGIPRADIFVTSKFWPQFAAPERVGVCLDRVLAGIGIEDVDLWVPRGGGRTIDYGLVWGVEFFV